MFRSILPSMIGLIQERLKAGEEEDAIRVMEVFDDLIESVSSVFSTFLFHELK